MKQGPTYILSKPFDLPPKVTREDVPCLKARIKILHEPTPFKNWL